MDARKGAWRAVSSTLALAWLFALLAFAWLGAVPLLAKYPHVRAVFDRLEIMICTAGTVFWYQHAQTVPPRHRLLHRGVAVFFLLLALMSVFQPH